MTTAKRARKPIDLAATLRRLGACRDAREWVGNRTAQEAWDECERPDWLMWAIENSLPAKASLVVRRKVVRIACETARRALPHVPKGEDRPRLAIETAERWSSGEPVTPAELGAAGAAAMAATRSASDAARSAAWAASDAVRAATESVWAVRAAMTAAWAARAARAAENKELCRIIRKHFPRVTRPQEVAA